MPPSRNILFVCSHLFGRVRATAELARRLSEEGHRVAIAAPARAQDSSRRHPVRMVDIPDFDLGGVSAGKAKGLHDFLPSRRRARLKKLEASLHLERFERLIAAENPDLIVIDAEMHPHIVTALRTATPVALFSDLFLAQPGPKVPPLDTNLSPGTHSPAKIRWAWVKLWWHWRRIQLKRWRRTAGADYLSLLRRMARDRGLAWHHYTTRWWWQVPIAWRRLPLVVMQGAPLDFPVTYGAQFRHVGPMLPLAPQLASDNDESLDRARSAKSQAKRVVYIAFGASFPAQAKVVRAVWEAVASCPDVFAIQTAAGRTDFQGGEMPENLCLVDWAPQRHLLELCDAAIIHAGVNTVLECIATSTPMLAIPRGIDQPGNAARIVYHGLGRICSQNTPPDTIAEALRDLLDDLTYSERCSDMHRSLQAYEHNKTAQIVFQDLLQVDASTATME